MRSPGLLIGGSSCVGKTTVAREISAQLGLAHVQTDCSLPADPCLRPLHGSETVWDRPAEDLCAQLISAAVAAIPYLIRQAHDLAEAESGWLLEGERVHPELVRQLKELRIARGVFVVETDLQRITQTLHERLPRFMSLAASRRHAVAKVDQLYNLWLIDEAARHGIVCVESQPWVSLADRILESIEWF